MAIFQGKKELFKDLYISKTDYDFKEYPVIHIDFSDLVVTKANACKESLLTVLNRIADEYNVALKETAEVKSLLKDLIIGLYHQHGKVVVLVDEYDKPLSKLLNSQKPM